MRCISISRGWRTNSFSKRHAENSINLPEAEKKEEHFNIIKSQEKLYESEGAKWNKMG